MSSFFSRLVSRWPSQRALLVASVVGLAALAVMAAGIVFPSPIVIVAGMSLAQLLGGVAFVLYLLSVAAEYRHDVEGAEGAGAAEVTPGSPSSEKPGTT